MATITNAETVTDRDEGNGSHFVLFRYTFSTGEVRDYGPIFPPSATDLAALRASIGNNLLDALAAAEINELLNG